MKKPLQKARKIIVKEVTYWWSVCSKGLLIWVPFNDKLKKKLIWRDSNASPISPKFVEYIITTILANEQSLATWDEAVPGALIIGKDEQYAHLQMWKCKSVDGNRYNAMTVYALPEDLFGSIIIARSGDRLTLLTDKGMYDMDVIHWMQLRYRMLDGQQQTKPTKKNRVQDPAHMFDV